MSSNRIGAEREHIYRTEAATVQLGTVVGGGSPQYLVGHLRPGDFPNHLAIQEASGYVPSSWMPPKMTGGVVGEATSYFQVSQDVVK